MLSVKEISRKIYEIIKTANHKLISAEKEKEKREIVKKALLEIQDLLQSCEGSTEKNASIVWNVTQLLAKDFGALLYEVMQDFLKSPENIETNTLLKAISSYFEKMQQKGF